MPDPSKQDRIQELERELAELRGDDQPLTLAEIRSMSKEEVDANWARVQRSLARVDDPDNASAAAGAEKPAASLAGGARIAKAYAERRDSAEQKDGER
jgi:hypothetical protein